MTRPSRYLLRMLVFLLLVAGLAWLLRVRLIDIVSHNPALNGAILAVLVIGIVYIVRQVLLLGPEVSWLDGFQRDRPATSEAANLRLLAPMAAMFRDRAERRLALSPMAMRSVLDGVSARLDESRETSRYTIGLMIFLGLLGTFWGLLETVQSVGDAIAGLQVAGGDAVQMFGRLKSSLEGPLKGMGTAFGASLFGLSGSLVLGFLDLQAGQAQNRFFNDLEDWLSGQTKFSSGALQVEGDASLPAYVEALLEQSAENIDKLQRTMARNEDGRAASETAVVQLTDRLSGLTDTLRQQQQLMAKLAENGVELRQILSRLADAAPAPVAAPLLDDGARQHLRNTEAYLARLLEETVRGRTALADELRGEFKLLARTLAARPAGPPSQAAALGAANAAGKLDTVAAILSGQTRASAGVDGGTTRGVATPTRDPDRT